MALAEFLRFFFLLLLLFFFSRDSIQQNELQKVYNVDKVCTDTAK